MFLPVRRRGEQSRTMNYFNSTFRIKVDAAKTPRLNRSRMNAPKRTRRLRASRPLKRKHRSKIETDWINDVRERDNYTCRWPKCGYYSKHIHAHHIHTKRQRPDLKWVASNGACLCFTHHDHLHHTVAGRRKARAIGLLGTKTYELAQKEKAA